MDWLGLGPMRILQRGRSGGRDRRRPVQKAADHADLARLKRVAIHSGSGRIVSVCKGARNKALAEVGERHRCACQALEAAGGLARVAQDGMARSPSLYALWICHSRPRVVSADAALPAPSEDTNRPAPTGGSPMTTRRRCSAPSLASGIAAGSTSAPSSEADAIPWFLRSGFRTSIR